MEVDIPVIDYALADYFTQRKLQVLMWLYRYGRYDSTTPYIANYGEEDAPSPTPPAE